MEVSSIGYNFIPCPLGITEYRSPEIYRKQLVELLTTPPANTESGIVYIWSTQKPIPRAKAESRIVYIGQTKQSLRDRYWKCLNNMCSGYPWERDKYLIENFGGFDVWIYKLIETGLTPKAIEKELIKKFYEEHFDLPPQNCTT